jgi:outer membrane protein TolC
LTALFNPIYPTWAAQYTQPLLRDFRIDATRQQLLVTRINQSISDIQLQQTTMNTIADVRNAYWDYVFAVQSVEVARQSLALADELLRNNQTKVEIGTMAPIDIVQAQSQAALQRQSGAGRGTRRTAELALKRLIVSGTQDPNWSAASIRSSVLISNGSRRHRGRGPPAPESRTDLLQARRNLQVNDVTVKYLRNQTLPQVDLTARYGLVGQGGTQYLSSGSGINRVVTGTLPGGYGDALGSLFGQSFPTWNVALNVSYPLGTSAQEASVARARVQTAQVEAQLRQIELQVATVTNAATQVQNNVDCVQAAQAAREFARQSRRNGKSKGHVDVSGPGPAIGDGREQRCRPCSGSKALVS